LAVELNHDKQVCAVVDLTGKVQHRIEREFCVHSHSPREVCEVVQDMVGEIISKPEFADKRFRGIGVALPGLIDMETGMVLLGSYFRWQNIPLGAMLREMFPDMTVTLDNEMNACALSESLYGELRHTQNAVVLGFGAGVGAGIIANGRIYRGDRNMAGEVGHIIMDPSGKMCQCGCYGCLQTYVADWALLEDAHQFKRNANIADILQAAETGEQWAISIIDRFVRYTKTAISYFTNLLNPGTVVLTGRLIEDNPDLYKRLLQEYPTEQVQNPFSTPFRLTTSGLGRDGAIIGAAAHLLHKVYEEYI